MLFLAILCAAAFVAMVGVCLIGSGGTSNRDLEKRLEERAAGQGGVTGPSSVSPHQPRGTDGVSAGSDAALSTTS